MKESRIKQARTKRTHDKRVIEAAVYRFGPISRVAIQNVTDLHPTTISLRVNELLAEGSLLKAGRADNLTGRKQVLLRLNEEHAFIVGLAFDDECVLSGTMDLYPKLRSKVQQSTWLGGGPEGLEKQLLACTKQAIREAGVDINSVLGIGIAGSGLINSREGKLVFSSTIGFAKEIPVRQIFEREFGVPTFVEHLGRAKAVAERVFGAGAGAADMVYVVYGKTGIGTGLIIDGRLVYGSGCAAGEFGHTHMLDDGPACRCGSFGCLEAIVGGAALEARIRKAIADGGTSEALLMADGDITKISGITVLEAAGRGDKTCMAIVEQLGDYLGLGLANIVSLLNPSVVVLDPHLAVAGRDLLDGITKVIKRQSLRYSTKDLIVCFGRLGIEASLLGLGSLALERHFEVPMLKPPRFMVETVSALSRGTLSRTLTGEVGQGN
jgi:predicted NBD/HSP70 family sugar kinase